MSADPSSLTSQHHADNDLAPAGRIPQASTAGPDMTVPVPGNAITTNQNEPLTDEFGNAIVTSEGGVSPA